MIKRIKSLLSSDVPLESKVFSVILFVGLVVAVISTIVTHFEGLGMLATVSTLMCGVLILLVMILNYVFKLERLSKVLLCYIINCF